MADVDDEDSWLYGDTTKEKTSIPAINNLNGKQPVKVENEEKIQQEPLVVTAPVVENGKESDGVDTTSLETKENNGKNEDDDEDSDDDVQVTIGEITTGGTPGNFPTQGLSRTFYRNPVPVPPKPTVSKGLDMQAPGDINGTPVMETNIDLLDDKPWRKPGADISDYFNYGFNEDTWKQYCDKQKKFRGQIDNTPVITLPLPKPTQNGTSLFSTPPYVPLAKFENTVRNISTLQFSRRKEDELLAASAAAAAASAVQNQAQNATPVPSTLPPSSATQVFLPQMRQTISGSLPNAPLPFPPINPNQPPPGLPIGVPPPFMMSNVPPPGIPPPGVVPPEYLQSAPPGYPPGFQPPVSHTVPPPMFNQQDGGDSYNQYPEDRHMRPSDSETDRHSEDDGRYRRERGSSSRRDYERDRYSRRDYRDSRPRDRDRDRSERDRDRDRDRERDRDRDREKDRDRDKERDRDRDRGHERESSSSRRYRDDSPSRHKSSRRKHEDDDRHSSKHKKAKKHKHKDKESDAPPPGTDDVGNEEGEK